MAQNDSIFNSEAFDGSVNSDYLELGRVSEEFKSQSIDYSISDFSEYKEALLKYIQAVYPLEYNNFVESDLGMMLIELFSYLASVVSLKADMIANEMYLPSVKNVGNLSKLLNLIGVSLKGPISAKATAQLTMPADNPVESTESVTIPLASRSFSVPNNKDGGSLFYSLYLLDLGTGAIDITNPDILLTSSMSQGGTGEVFNNLILLEGQLSQLEGSFSEQNTIQTINIPDSSIVEGSIVVSSQSGDVYKEVDNLFLADDGSETVFQKIYNDDYSCKLIFGDNVRGKSPTANLDYVVTYRVGGGDRGNVPSRTIENTLVATHSADGSISPLLVNLTHAAGGSNAEDVEHAKKWAPYFFKTQYRAVTGEDYTAFSNNFISTAGVTGKALSVLRRSGAGANIIDIFVVEKASTNQLQRATIPYKKELLEYLNTYKMITDEVVIVDGLVRTIDLVVSIFVDKELEVFEESVKRKAADVVVEFFKVDNRDFGERVKLSDLSRDIFQIPEIRFSKIENFSEDIRLGFNEILQLNNVEINIEYV